MGCPHAGENGVPEKIACCNKYVELLQRGISIDREPP